MEVLRSHVAEAQARANHIVDEFESMLMVTGGHSMKEVMHIQSQAGLVSNSPPAVKNRKLVWSSYTCSCKPTALSVCESQGTVEVYPYSFAGLTGGAPDMVHIAETAACAMMKHGCMSTKVAWHVETVYQSFLAASLRMTVERDHHSAACKRPMRDPP